MQQDNQKKINGLGWLFFIIIAIYLAATVCIQILSQKGIELNTYLALTLSELLVVVPGLVYIIVTNTSIKEDMGFRKIKIGTVFMTLLLSMFVAPIASFVNILTQFFVPNTMIEASDSLMAIPGLPLLFITGVFAPVCEEFVFRGIFDKKYSEVCTPVKGMLVAAIFFGLMHLNINQTCYAIVLGLIFAIVNRASGSIFTSIIIHVAINTGNVLMLLVATAAYSGMDGNLKDAANEMRGGSFMYVMAAVYMVIAIVCILISIPIIVWISKHEGRYDNLKSVFAKTGTKVRAFFNVPTVLAIVLCLVVMFSDIV